MKRICHGLLILTLLLFVSIVFTVFMDRIHAPMAELLLEASEAATAGDWAAAAALASQANNRWQHHRGLTAALADHSPMDDMEGLFGELEVYLQLREMPHFVATCHHLARLAEAMGENHALNWWNFL